MKIERISSVLAALILLQTLFFKFTAAPESVYIFEQLGAEPYGRIGTGVIELIVAGLLLFKRTSLLGGILSMGVISGAIFSHIFVLGIEVQEDGGLLFGLALLVFVFSFITVWTQKDTLISFIALYKK
ncbi:DoxX family protein [Lutimonas sp.]|uniref:DoxX family protein n=1 Tax=Lutimonas sp. TaxID=1872403 RepID=UPI003D9BBB46